MFISDISIVFMNSENPSQIFSVFLEDVSWLRMYRSCPAAESEKDHPTGDGFDVFSSQLASASETCQGV